MITASSTENLQAMLDYGTIEPPPPTKPGLFVRLFAPISPSSLRLAVINIIICIVSNSFFVFPIAFRAYGIYVGVALLFASNVMNFLTCKFIYEASEYINDNNYLKIIGVLLGERFVKVAKFTFLMDYFSNYMISILMGWNITQYILVCQKLIGPEAIINNDTLEVNPYNPQVLNFRLMFLVVVFIVFTPIISGKNQELLKYIMIGYLGAFLVFIFYSSYDLLDFYDYYNSIGKYQITYYTTFSGEWLKYLFIIITAFYIQPSLMTMKAEIQNPNLRRVIKSARIAYIYLTFISIMCGLYCYLCLGDIFTSDVFMLRKSFEGKKRETIYKSILAIIALMSLLYAKFYHSNMKTFLAYNYLNQSQAQFLYLIPWIGALMLTLAYPKIIDFLGYNSVTIFILNGYCFPIMLKRKILALSGKACWKIKLCELGLVGLAVLAAASFVALLTVN
jgi:amino acid permease